MQAFEEGFAVLHVSSLARSCSKGSRLSTKKKKKKQERKKRKKKEKKKRRVGGVMGWVLGDCRVTAHLQTSFPLSVQRERFYGCRLGFESFHFHLSRREPTRSPLLPLPPTSCAALFRPDQALQIGKGFLWRGCRPLCCLSRLPGAWNAGRFDESSPPFLW